MAKFNYAIELSNNTVIYKIGYGIILDEPSLIAIREVNKKSVIECVGNDAQKLIGKEPANLEIVEPIKDNVIVNKTYAIAMLKEFVKKIKEPFESMSVVLLHSVGLSKNEKNELVNLLYNVNFKDVLSVPSCMTSLLQMDTDVMSCNSSMVVNLSNITDIAVVNNGEVINGCTVDLGANMLDIAIKQYVADNYNSDITLLTATKIRKEIATLLANDVSRYSLVANDINGYGSTNVIIESQEIRGILTELFGRICGTIQGVLSLCTAQVVEEVKRKGIYLCGELCEITGIERFMKSKLNIAVYCDTEPKNTTILGGGVLLNNPHLINEFAVKK